MKALWKHQTECCERARDVDHFSLFFEMGAGKTRCTIEIIKEKFEQAGRQLKVLVIAPTVVTFTWKKELAQFSDINPQHVIVLHGTQVERKRMLERTPNYFVVIMNYESLMMDMVFTHLKVGSLT